MKHLTLLMALLSVTVQVRAQEDSPPPPLEDTAPPPGMEAADTTAPSMFATPPAAEAPVAATAVDTGNAPPPLDGSAPVEVPPAAVLPPPDRPFVARFNTLEIGLTVGSLAAGWAVAAAAHVVGAVLAVSFAAGRPAWDLPLMVFNAARAPLDTNTSAARVFGGTNSGFMLGGLLGSILIGAFGAAAVATGFAALSQDWETSLGPVAAAGFLGAAVCAAVGGTLFLASLLVPVPPLWVAAFAVAGLVGVVVPPLVVVAGQVLTKQARAVPGGIITVVMQQVLQNPMVRQRLGGLN